MHLMYYREKCARPVCVAGEAAKSGTVYSWFMSSEDTAAKFWFICVEK